MTPTRKYQEIHEGLQAILEKITAADYCEKTPRTEFQRDIAQALELGQQKEDGLQDLLDGLSCDMEYFKEYSKIFDEIMERHGQPQPES